MTGMNKPQISTNVYFHKGSVSRACREARNGHRGAILWFTGLSGAGKSTLAHSVEEALFQMGCQVFVMDGDNLRHGLCGNLGFSSGDRAENVRRIGEVAKLFLEAGVIVLTAFISPFRKDRTRVRSMFSPDDFMEIYCQCPIEVCESRDVKGIYKKARTGQITEFTGISSPYEEPEHPELVINTAESAVGECTQRVIDILSQRGIVGKK